jgi:hypothetical protein
MVWRAQTQVDLDLSKVFCEVHHQQSILFETETQTWYFIKRWLDKKLNPEDVPTTYQADEPGFEDGED